MEHVIAISWVLELQPIFRQTLLRFYHVLPGSTRIINSHHKHNFPKVYLGLSEYAIPQKSNTQTSLFHSYYSLYLCLLFTFYYHIYNINNISYHITVVAQHLEYTKKNISYGLNRATQNMLFFFVCTYYMVREHLNMYEIT